MIIKILTGVEGENNLISQVFKNDKCQAFVFECVSQFSSVTQSCLSFCDPMDYSMPGFPVHHQLLELLKLMSIELVMPSNHLILCPSPTPGVHSNSCPSSQWCHPTISSSVIPFSSCSQSFRPNVPIRLGQIWRRKWQPTPVFLPGESPGQGILAGHGPWGHRGSDTTQATKHASTHVKHLA